MDRLSRNQRVLEEERDVVFVYTKNSKQKGTETGLMANINIINHLEILGVTWVFPKK